jgi:hypothetical protein
MSDPARVTAYEDALRQIAWATVTARRHPHDLSTLQTFLCDTEHYLATLIALGYVPPSPQETRHETLSHPAPQIDPPPPYSTAGGR